MIKKNTKKIETNQEIQTPFCESQRLGQQKHQIQDCYKNPETKIKNLIIHQNQNQEKQQYLNYSKQQDQSDPFEKIIEKQNNFQVFQKEKKNKNKLSVNESKLNQVKHSKNFNLVQNIQGVQFNQYKDYQVFEQNKQKQIKITQRSQKINNKINKDLHFLQKTSVTFKDRFKNKLNKLNRIGQIIKLQNYIDKNMPYLQQKLKNEFHNKKLVNQTKFQRRFYTNQSTSRQKISRMSLKKIQNMSIFNNNNKNNHQIINFRNLIENRNIKKARSLQASKANSYSQNGKSFRSTKNGHHSTLDQNQSSQNAYECNNHFKDKLKSKFFSIKEEQNEETITKIKQRQRRILTPLTTGLKKYPLFKDQNKNQQNFNKLIKKDKSKNTNQSKSHLFFDKQPNLDSVQTSKIIKPSLMQQIQSYQFKQLLNEQRLLQQQIQILNLKRKNQSKNVDFKEKEKQNFQKQTQVNFVQQIENQNFYPLSLKKKQKCVTNFNRKDHFSKNMIRRLQEHRKIFSNIKQQKQSESNRINCFLPKVTISQKNQKNQKIRIKSLR